MAMALDWNVGRTMKKDKTEAGEDSSSIHIIISSKIFRSGKCCCCNIVVAAVGPVIISHVVLVLMLRWVSLSRHYEIHNDTMFRVAMLVLNLSYMLVVDSLA